MRDKWLSNSLTGQFIAPNHWSTYWKKTSQCRPSLDQTMPMRCKFHNDWSVLDKAKAISLLQLASSKTSLLFKQKDVEMLWITSQAHSKSLRQKKKRKMCINSLSRLLPLRIKLAIIKQSSYHKAMMIIDMSLRLCSLTYRSKLLGEVQNRVPPRSQNSLQEPVFGKNS